MQGLEMRINALRQAIAENDGENIAGPAFRREVEALVDAFYDDIGHVTLVSARSLFDLIVIKTLYVDRASRDAAVVDYLGAMLTRHLYTRELFPIVRDNRRSLMYISDLMEQMRNPVQPQNLFEHYRQFGDNALFITGVLPNSVRPGRRRPRGFVDQAYYITSGKAFYRRAGEHELAWLTQQRETLLKLSRHFEVYMDALNDASENFILGLDMNVIANKMLDAFNRYRASGEEGDLENARKYAALLKVDAKNFPALFRRRPGRAVLLDGPRA
ncbi:MAG TPA: hypothetical protein VNL92_01840 [Dehalococcoidia bacterium]|nr:hypothetical protein [Dehalococcoidia bacterium]